MQSDANEVGDFRAPDDGPQVDPDAPSSSEGLEWAQMSLIAFFTFIITLLASGWLMFGFDHVFYELEYENWFSIGEAIKRNLVLAHKWGVSGYETKDKKKGTILAVKDLSDLDLKKAIAAGNVAYRGMEEEEKKGDNAKGPVNTKGLTKEEYERKQLIKARDEPIEKTRKVYQQKQRGLQEVDERFPEQGGGRMGNMQAIRRLGPLEPPENLFPEQGGGRMGNLEAIRGLGPLEPPEKPLFAAGKFQWKTGDLRVHRKAKDTAHLCAGAAASVSRARSALAGLGLVSSMIILPAFVNSLITFGFGFGLYKNRKFDDPGKLAGFALGFFVIQVFVLILPFSLTDSSSFRSRLAMALFASLLCFVTSLMYTKILLAAAGAADDKK